jgi:hypothetical protein
MPCASDEGYLLIIRNIKRKLLAIIKMPLAKE